MGTHTQSETIGSSLILSLPGPKLLQKGPFLGNPTLKLWRMPKFWHPSHKEKIVNPYRASSFTLRRSSYEHVILSILCPLHHPTLILHTCRCLADPKLSEKSGKRAQSCFMVYHTTSYVPYVYLRIIIRPVSQTTFSEDSSASRSLGPVICIHHWFGSLVPTRDWKDLT